MTRQAAELAKRLARLNTIKAQAEEAAKRADARQAIEVAKRDEWLVQETEEMKREVARSKKAQIDNLGLTRPAGQRRSLHTSPPVLKDEPVDLVEVKARLDATREALSSMVDLSDPSARALAHILHSCTEDIERAKKEESLSVDEDERPKSPSLKEAENYLPNQLTKAIRENDVKRLKILMDHPEFPSFANESIVDEMTMLQYAAFLGFPEIIETLQENRYVLDYAGAGQNPAEIARNRTNNVRDILSSSPDGSIIDISEEYDRRLGVERALSPDRGVSAAKKDPRGDGLLDSILGGSRGKWGGGRRELHISAPVLAGNNNALHIAASLGSIKAIKNLIETDPNLFLKLAKERNDDGHTPLMLVGDNEEVAQVIGEGIASLRGREKGSSPSPRPSSPESSKKGGDREGKENGGR